MLSAILVILKWVKTILALEIKGSGLLKEKQLFKDSRNTYKQRALRRDGASVSVPRASSASSCLSVVSKNADFITQNLPCTTF